MLKRVGVKRSSVLLLLLVVCCVAEVLLLVWMVLQRITLLLQVGKVLLLLLVVLVLHLCLLLLLLVLLVELELVMVCGRYSLRGIAAFEFAMTGPRVCQALLRDAAGGFKAVVVRCVDVRI